MPTQNVTLGSGPVPGASPYAYAQRTQPFNVTGTPDFPPGGYYQQGGTAASPANINLDGAGNPTADPNIFQRLLTNVQGAVDKTGAAFQGISPAAFATTGRLGRYAPGAVAAAQQLSQGQPLAAAGTLGATALLGKGIKTLAGAIPNPALRAGAELVGGLVAAPIAGQLGQGVAALGNQLVGGAQAAVQDVAGGVAATQREAGRSAFTGQEVGLGGASQNEINRQTELLRQLQVNLPYQALATNYQITQKYKDADAARIMQLNQQNAQLTGALNRQMAGYQLASQGLGETGATTRTILTSNPYASSVLNTGNVRGIA